MTFFFFLSFFLVTLQAQWQLDGLHNLPGTYLSSDLKDHWILQCRAVVSSAVTGVTKGLRPKRCINKKAHFASEMWITPLQLRTGAGELLSIRLILRHVRHYNWKLRPEVKDRRKPGFEDGSSVVGLHGEWVDWGQAMFSPRIMYSAKLSEVDFPRNPSTVDTRRYEPSSLIIEQSCPGGPIRALGGYT